MLLKNLITQLGTDPRRVRLEWISAAEGLKFAQVINDFTNEIKELGPYHTKNAPLHNSRESLRGLTLWFRGFWNVEVIQKLFRR